MPVRCLDTVNKHIIPSTREEKESAYRTAQQRQMTEEVLNSVKTIREDMPRLGGRKLHYLLSDEFEKSGLKVGRDKLFSILRDSNLLIHKKKCYVWILNY